MLLARLYPAALCNLYSAESAFDPWLPNWTHRSANALLCMCRIALHQDRPLVLSHMHRFGSSKGRSANCTSSRMCATQL